MNYKIGDLVRIIKDQYLDQWCSTQKGEWGKIYRIDFGMLDIQLAGYSRKQNAFFQAATRVIPSDVEPYENLQPHNKENS